MAALGRFWKALNRRRTFDSHEYDSELSRVLTLFDLTIICVGSSLGLGVYVLAGSVAYDVAGPGVTISFLIAATASTFSGLCYAELAARVPRAGSAYIYSYVMVGEFVAFTIGWNLVLEYTLSAAGVARGLSGYVDKLTGRKMSEALSSYWPMTSSVLGAYPDVLSFCMIALLTLLLGWDVKMSSIANAVFTILNLSTICIVIVAGGINVQPGNWAIDEKQVPEGFGTGGFLPYGISGIFIGAAKCFFGFVGFDSIATTGEEALKPKRNIPLALIISLAIIFLAYFGISVVLTMATPYYNLDPSTPLIHIFEELQWNVIKWIVTVGALFALSTSLLGSLFPLPRVIYSMAADRLIFFTLSRINRHTKTPIIATIVSGLMSGTMALVFDLDHLIEMMSIGTLMAYSIVSVCIIILRYEEYEMEAIPLTISSVFKQLCNCGQATQPTSLSSGLAVAAVCCYALGCAIWCGLATLYQLTGKLSIAPSGMQIAVLSSLGALLLLCVVVIARQPMAKSDLTFQVPLVPYIPCLSIFINLNLMFQLDVMTWVRFLVWLMVGYLIYFTYGIRHSNQFDRDSKTKSSKENQEQ